MKTICRRLMLAGLSAAAVVAATTGAFAEGNKLRLAYLQADSMLPMLFAQDKGYFKEVGIELEATAAQGGPAAVAAVASGEADIGYSAFVPPINARIGGVPLKLFLTLSHEAEPDFKYTFLVASKASGIANLQGSKGKKVSFNANGGLCELMWRDHLAANGMKIEDVSVVILPFPEQEKALEQGSIDAACTINPFYASISSNEAIGHVMLASGMLADLKTPVISDGVYATEDWLSKNSETAAKFAQVMDKARKELLADRAALEAASVKFFELTPEAAKKMVLPVYKAEMTVTAEDVQKVLDAMIRTGMQQGPLNGADFVAPATY